MYYGQRDLTLIVKLWPCGSLSTAKAALIGFTRIFSVEIGQHGINVNMLSGGLLKTTDAISETSPEDPEIIKNTTITTLSEVTQMVLFLGSDRNIGLTRQNITVDGGLTMN